MAAKKKTRKKKAKKRASQKKVPLVKVIADTGPPPSDQDGPSLKELLDKLTTSVPDGFFEEEEEPKGYLERENPDAVEEEKEEPSEPVAMPLPKSMYPPPRQVRKVEIPSNKLYRVELFPRLFRALCEMRLAYRGEIEGAAGYTLHAERDDVFFATRPIITEIEEVCDREITELYAEIKQEVEVEGATAELAAS